MPKIISVNSVTEGMILSEPIINKHGQVLLGSDIIISKKHINFFKMWNIELISVHSNEEEEENSDFLSSVDYEIAKANLKKRILWSPRNQNEEDLFELGIIYEGRKLNKSNNYHNEN
jgi:hypothetical protein